MTNKLSVCLLVVLLASALAQDYQVALPGYQYQFPRDHFSHPDYQTEWWYYTGNLKSADGHRFGFELTFFRQGVSRDRKDSPWNIHDLYMAHFALSDVSGGRFYHEERLNRAGPGIAGIDAHKNLIWNGNWQVQLTGKQQVLHALTDEFALQLNLSPSKPPVIHGLNGISEKGIGRGKASHYISFTRLLTSGSIQLHGKSYPVEGTSWMDHEFFTESLDSSTVGWDWLSLQFNDNTELMLYRLRHQDGSVDPYSSGTYVDASGKSIFLSAQQFTMIPTGSTWTSPQSKGRYPIAWVAKIPSLNLQVAINSRLQDQELITHAGPSYWEGAIDVAGQRSGQSITGVGYLEMTGYSSALGPDFEPK